MKLGRAGLGRGVGGEEEEAGVVGEEVVAGLRRGWFGLREGPWGAGRLWQVFLMALGKPGVGGGGN